MIRQPRDNKLFLQMIPISVCMIAGNEAARIRRTLESVAGWAAEIVIVINDDVTDGTEKIAAEFGAKVFRETWKGFGPQKQSAAEKCTQPWMLNLDADEAVSPELRLEITNLMSDENRSRAHAAYSFPAAPFIADAGYGMATGIPTGRFACGGRGRRIGPQSWFTKNCRWQERSAGCAANSSISAWIT